MQSVQAVRPEIIKGPFQLDGVVGFFRVRCPGCGTIGIIDPDQYAGRVSIECAEPGCTYHETHDLSKEVT